MQFFRRHSISFCAIAITAASLVGCKSVTTNDTVDYKNTGAVRGPNLSYPPDLITAQADRRYVVQDGSATMSEYSAAVKKTAQMKSNVLNGIPGMHIERDGDRRWLVVERPAADLYPQVKDFWQENGFLLVIDSPSTGIMETDWVENRAKVPQDWLRSFLGGALDSIYDTGERDRYKTRLEAIKPNVTEIFITQQGSIEKCTDSSGACGSTIWTKRPNDPELEAAFLSRLMQRLGMTQEQAKAMASVPLAAKIPKAKLVQGDANAAHIDLNSGFDRAWRDVGLALDRSNFTVEDRDRSIGIYYVRYVNSKETGEKKGFFSGLFSSNDDESILKAKKYRILVKANGDGASIVTVQNADGGPENTPAGLQLLTMLTEQLSR